MKARPRLHVKLISQNILLNAENWQASPGDEPTVGVGCLVGGHLDLHLFRLELSA